MTVLVITDIFEGSSSFEFESIVYLLSNSWTEARRQAKELFLADVETERQEESSMDENMTYWDDDADYGIITWASGSATYEIALVNDLPSFTGEERRGRKCDEKNLDEVSFLRKLASDDEGNRRIHSSRKLQYGLLPYSKQIGLKNIDVGGGLEETLHRIIDQDERNPAFCGYSKEEAIAAVMLADKDPAEEDEEGIEIDLGYRIHGSLLTFDLV